MKKKFALILIAAITFATKFNSQNKFFLIDYGSFSPTNVVPLSLTDSERDKFKNQTNDKIIVKVENVPNGYTTPLKANTGSSNALNGNAYEIDITQEIAFAINSNRDFQLIQIKQTSDDAIKHQMKISWTKIEPVDEKLVAEKQTQLNRQDEIDKMKLQSSFSNPYNNKKNRIDLYFDERGKLLNYLPVNVDANDYFFMHVVCPVKDENNYRINVLEGEYTPVDLSIRPFVKPMAIGNSAGATKKYEAVTYKTIDLRAGPFTSDNFKFQIAFDSTSGKTFNGPSYSLKINKLHHVGVGVSIVHSDLENPDFRVAPLSAGGNTIEKYNDGGRTILTFNVIWYWSIFHQKPKGSVITSGRDVLKDEPTFSLHRIYPTLGVNLTKNLNENIFAGFVYEFARGGSIIVGAHYGKVKELSDKNFTLGQDTFLGGDADIRTNNVYKSSIFFGVNLDTRIFNTLFGRGE